MDKHRFTVAIVDDMSSNLDTLARGIIGKCKCLEVRPINADVSDWAGRKSLDKLKFEDPLYDIYIIDVSLEGEENVDGLIAFADLWERSINEKRPIWVIIYSRHDDIISILGRPFGGRKNLPLHFEDRLSESGVGTYLLQKLEAIWEFNTKEGLSLATHAAKLAEDGAVRDDELGEWLEAEKVFVPHKQEEMSLACYFPDLATTLGRTPKQANAIRTQLLQRMSFSSLWVWYQKFFLDGLPEWEGRQIVSELIHHRTIHINDDKAALESARRVDRSLAQELDKLINYATKTPTTIKIPGEFSPQCESFKDSHRLELIKALLHPYDGQVLPSIERAGITIVRSECPVQRLCKYGCPTPITVEGLKILKRRFMQRPGVVVMQSSWSH